MANYRVYFLNGQGRIVRAVDLPCESDEEARSKAQALAENQVVELWERARQLGRFEPPQRPHKKTPPQGPGPGDP